jgi:pimeloyl-ACP methyl ester carboxylesterase
MRLTRRCAPVYTVALAALTLLGACADEALAPTVPRAPDSAGASVQGVLRDRGIDRGDSHFSARVITTSEQPGFGGGGDFAAQEVVTSTDELYVEGGYDRSGQLHFGVWFESAEQSPTIGSIRAVGDEVSVYDRGDTRFESQIFDAFMASIGMPGGTLIGAFFPSVPPGTDPCASDPYACEPAAQSTPGAMVTTEDVGDLRIVRTELEPSGIGAMHGGDRVSMVHRYRRIVRSAAPANTPPAHTEAVESWRLEEVVREQWAGPVGAARRVLTRQRMEYGTWHRNPGQDRVREARAREQAAARVAVSVSAVPLPATFGPVAEPRSLLARDVTTETSDAILDQVCRTGTLQVEENFTAPAGAPSLLFQHGFCGDASTWNGFRTMMRAQYQPARIRAYSLGSTQRIDSQVVDLAGRIREKRARPYILLGHSAGGIVGRRLGQLHPTYVEGVVTIGSPNIGSMVADLGPEIVSELLSTAAQSPCFSGPVCELIADLFTEQVSGRFLSGFAAALAPAVDDLRRGSPFMTTLNSTPEPFPRVSVDVTVPTRWAFARMIGDGRTPRERLERFERPRGDAWVTNTQRVYVAVGWVRALSAFAIFQMSPYGGGVSCSLNGYSSSWPACTTPSSLTNWYAPWYQSFLTYLLFDISGRVLYLMDRLDGTWTYVTTRGEAGDGFVHTASQRYPNTPGIFPPLRLSIGRREGDSHAGETASPTVLRAVDDAMAHIQSLSNP